MERLAAPGRRSRREAHGPGGIDRQHGARHRREREPRRKPGPDAPDFKVDDRRVARSKRLIRGAFQELLAEKGYEAVTASMVIERADVGRATFYARFSSKEALMADLLDQICAHVIAPVEPEPEHDFTRSETPEALVEHALRHLLEQGSGVRALALGGGSGELAGALRKSAVANVGRFLPEARRGVASGLDRDFLERYVAGGASSRWP